MIFSIIKAKDLSWFANRLSQWQVVVVDCETDGVEPYLGSKLLGFGLGELAGEDEYFYVPAGEFDLQSIWKALAGKPLVGHNLKFDLHMLVQNGYEYTGQALYDTIVMARLYETDEHPKLDLKWQAKDKLGYEYEMQQVVEGRKSINKFSQEEIARYCCEDAHTTKHLAKWFRQNLDETALKLFGRECALTRTLWRMEHAGWYYDQEYLGKLKIICQEYMESELVCLRQEAGRDDFNTGSPLQVQTLMEKLGIKPITYSVRTAKPSWDKAAMAEIDHPVANRITRVRMLRHVEEGIVKLLGRYQESGSSFVHGRYHNWGTVTGRLSSQDPNLQNFNRGWLQLESKPYWDDENPKEKEISIRRLFSPPPGYVVVSCDYRQLEMFILGYYMKDHVFQKLLDSEDFHGATATLVWHSQPGDDGWKAIRRRAKNFNFGLVYGMGVERTAAELEASIDQTRVWRRQYFSQIQGYYPLRGTVEEAIERYGFIRNFFGRKYVTDAHHAFNYIIQGTAGDFVKWKLPQIEPFCQKADIILVGCTHDEVILYAPKNNLGALSPIIDVLEFSPFGFRLPVNAKVSSVSLADLEPLKGVEVAT